MARLLLLAATLLWSVLLASAPTTLAAQEAPEVDVQALGQTVIGIDTQSLATALEEPIAEDQLPEGFISAEYVDPDASPEASEELSEQGLIPTSDLPGTEASVAYSIEGDPEVLGGVVTINSLNYVIINPEDVTDTLLDDIRKGVEEGIGTPTATGSEAAVEETEIAGTEALLLTFNVTDETANAAVQMYMVPVGNVIVIGLVTVADQEEVDPETVRVPAEELTIAGIAHLGMVVDGAQ